MTVLEWSPPRIRGGVPVPKGDREILKADCEDGYTRIANLILEAIPLARLSRIQTGICLFLWRRTYGWSRNEDAISLAEFAAACGSSRAYISRQLAVLIERNIVQRRDYQPGRKSVYAFTTTVALWDNSCMDVQGLHKNTTEGLYKSTTVVLHSSATVNQEPDLEPPRLEDPLKKEVKKIERNIYSPESTELHLAELLLKRIRHNLPGYKQPDLQKWAKGFDCILRIDRRDPQEVIEVIRFAQDDYFWQGNILSPEKLRHHYDLLNLRRKKSRAAPGKDRQAAKSKINFPIYYGGDIVMEKQE
ncbi:MAG: replication protein [Syntrophomonadaceae bacterium]